MQIETKTEGRKRYAPKSKAEAIAEAVESKKLPPSKRAKKSNGGASGRRSQTGVDDLGPAETMSPGEAQEKLNWKALKHVETIERKPDGTLAVWVQWKNGTQTSITHEAARNFCPIALIDFYERHLKFHEVTDENDQQ